jgi:hypothetical protein
VVMGRISSSESSESKSAHCMLIVFGNYKKEWKVGSIKMRITNNLLFLRPSKLYTNVKFDSLVNAMQFVQRSVRKGWLIDGMKQ